MAPDKLKSEASRSSAKTETVNLKVFIHCEGCKKKVKKTLSQIDGVQTVDVDAKLGKVTVVGAVDSKVLVKKLEKAGKVAEVLPSGGGGGGGGGGGKVKEQQKEQQKQAKKVRFEGLEDDKQGKGGGDNGNSIGEMKGKSNDSTGEKKGGGTANSNEERSGKKKKGGDGGDEAGSNKNTAQKNTTPVMIETGYSVETADYATHLFSDENTESCDIM